MASDARMCADIGYKLYVDLSVRFFSDNPVSDKRLLVCGSRLCCRAREDIRRRRCNSTNSYCRSRSRLAVSARNRNPVSDFGFRLPRRRVF